MPGLGPFAPLAPFLPRILATVAVVVIVILLTRIGRRGMARLVADPRRRYHGYKLLGRLTGLVLVLTLVFLWAPVRRDLLTVFTILGTGVAITLREALLSVIGWMHLAIRGTYRHGDRIEVNEVQGDVVDVRLLHTTLVEVEAATHQSTGRLVHIPNHWVLVHPVVNETHGLGYVWAEFAVTVTADSDWQAARDLLESLAEETAPMVEARARERLARLSAEYLVQYSILTPFVYVAVVEKGVQLTLRHLVEVRQRRGIEHAYALAFLDGVKAHGGIVLAGS